MQRRGKHAKRTRAGIAMLAASFLFVLQAVGGLLVQDAAQPMISTAAYEIHHLIDDLIGRNPPAAHSLHRLGYVPSSAFSPGVTPQRSVTSRKPGNRTSSLATTHTLRPKVSTAPRPTPSYRAEPNVSVHAHVLNISIKLVNSLNVLGISLSPLNLLSRPLVTLDGRIVTQGCRIDWTVMSGTVPVYQTATLCADALNLTSILDVGNYRLVGKATLQSGLTAENSVDFQIAN